MLDEYVMEIIAMYSKYNNSNREQGREEHPSRSCPVETTRGDKYITLMHRPCVNCGMINMSSTSV